MTAPFLRTPPFPHHRAPPLAVPGCSDRIPGSELAESLRRWRVGGHFWSIGQSLPAGGDLVIGARPLASDPWMQCEQAGRVIVDGSNETALVAALCGTPLEITGPGRFAALADPAALAELLEEELCGRWKYVCPFTGRALDPIEAIALLGRWRRLIEANRDVAAVYGVARWKRITSDPMLWDGTGPVRHERSAKSVGPGVQVLAWISRTGGETLAALKKKGIAVGEIEDGMIRSTGLGANCVPPLSIVVDRLGPHFDPAQPSELETLLETADIGHVLCKRAAALRDRLVGEGIGKYGRDGHQVAAPRHEARREVLVTGQVEDDRSVLCGGGGIGNLELLQRTRAAEPEAWIVFKPHPDVEAGHRKGNVPDAEALQFADEIDRSSSIAALLGRVDAVHVLTSLAGFEALMRGLEVVTHGVPFYAGWGLTRDLGPVPARRKQRRTIEQLVAATLILYPRYLDPVTRLPCEPEVLIERIASDEARVRSPLIRLREIQGRLNRLLQGANRR